MAKLSTHQRRARDYIQREQWDEALSELRAAIGVDASNPTLHNQMGDIFLRKEEITRACEHFETAIDLYTELRLHNNAVALCRKVMRLCPSRIEVRYRLARLRFDQGLNADAVASFLDYLQHQPSGSETEIQTLEERCREIVERFPHAAPLGKILERLEQARSFQCAFEIVQRLAQRAADAGDDGAAARYTEKMRSLRVLVEGAGGGDILSESAAAPPAKPEAAPHPAEVAPHPESVVTPAAPTISSPQPDTGAELSLDAIDPASLRITPPSAPAPNADHSEVPEIDLEPTPGPAHADTESVDLASSPGDASTSLEPASPSNDISGDSGSDFDLSVLEPDLQAQPEMSHPEVIAPDDKVVRNVTQDVNEPAGVGELDRNPDTSGTAPHTKPGDDVPEYEIPETSFDELAELIGENSVAPQPSSEPQPAEPAAPTPARVDPVSPPTPPPVDSVPPSVPAAASHPPPAPHTQRAPEPDAAPRDSNWARGFRQPVWIPDSETDDPELRRAEGGRVHELEDVIGTFREQMAQALGDDASARYDLGVAYYEMGLYNEALAEFEVAVGNPALREQSLEMMAACLTMQGRHEEIVALLTPVLGSAQSPGAGLGLRYTMGVACEALGRRDEARRHFEAVANVDSGYRDVQARLQRF